jgi:hypothetical protein
MNADARKWARSRTPVRLAAVTLFTLISCARESPPPEEQESSPPPPAEQPARPDSEAPVPRDEEWTSGIVDAPAQLQGLPPIPVVSALRSGVHGGFDRVTIELAGDGLPGYHAEYVDKPLHQCGSGAEVFPVGEGWLEIRLEPAQAHTEQGQPTLSGREIEAAGRLLRRIYMICDFEGVVSIVLALDSPNPYHVSTLQSPSRIIVDVRH